MPHRTIPHHTPPHPTTLYHPLTHSLKPSLPPPSMNAKDEEYAQKLADQVGVFNVRHAHWLQEQENAKAAKVAARESLAMRLHAHQVPLYNVPSIVPSTTSHIQRPLYSAYE